jgi:hypothetical protein
MPIFDHEMCYLLFVVLQVGLLFHLVDIFDIANWIVLEEYFINSSCYCDNTYLMDTSILKSSIKSIFNIFVMYLKYEKYIYVNRFRES